MTLLPIELLVNRIPFSYVKFDLEQDNMIMDKQYGSQKSSTKNNDTSPEYQETFWFEIPVSKLLEFFE